MSTNVRSEISKRSPWYISRERYYELKHYCRQYNSWIDIKNLLIKADGCYILDVSESNDQKSPVETAFEKRSEYDKKISEVHEALRLAAPVDIRDYIFKAVTQGLSYVTLRYCHDMPLSRNQFYDYYRHFFYELDRIHR